MITVHAEDLFKAIKAVKSTEFHKTLPVLNYAKIELTDDGARITTNNLMKKTESTFPYWGNGERWSTCVPMITKTEYYNRSTHKTEKHKYYPFYDFIRIMDEYNATLRLEFIENIQTLIVYWESSRTEFKCLDAMEFPVGTAD